MSEAPNAPRGSSASLPLTERGDARDALRLRLSSGLRAAGRADIRFGRHDRMLYATDASIYQVEPIGVVVPHSVEDAKGVLAYLAAAGVPVLPRGSGTALAGQSVNEAVIVDFSQHCRAILSVDAAARRAVVEPGVTLDQLNEHLAPTGLMFGPDVATSSHATLGGMIGYFVWFQRPSRNFPEFGLEDKTVIFQKANRPIIQKREDRHRSRV
jgi:hypothetical protein